MPIAKCFSHAPLFLFSQAIDFTFILLLVEGLSPEMFRDLSVLILRPFSLFHVTLGWGLPRAVHSKVTLLPSVLTLSPLLKLSSIRGGTENKEGSLKWSYFHSS